MIKKEDPIDILIVWITLIWGISLSFFRQRAEAERENDSWLEVDSMSECMVYVVSTVSK